MKETKTYLKSCDPRSVEIFSAKPNVTYLIGINFREDLFLQFSQAQNFQISRGLIFANQAITKFSRELIFAITVYKAIIYNNFCVFCFRYPGRNPK